MPSAATTSNTQSAAVSTAVRYLGKAKMRSGDNEPGAVEMPAVGSVTLRNTAMTAGAR